VSDHIPGEALRATWDAFTGGSGGEDEDPQTEWRREVAYAERRDDQAEVERLKKNPPPGIGISPRALAPRIIAADVGHDPSSAMAVAWAALVDTQRGQVPKLERTFKLAITLNDADGRAAQFTRRVLDLLGRPDIAVAASKSGAAAEELALTEVVPTNVPEPPDDVIGAVRKVTEATPYLVHWINHGPLTVLSSVLDDDPDLARRLIATIAADPVAGSGTHHPGQPFFGSDPQAAAKVVVRLREPSWELRDPRTAIDRLYPPTMITIDPAAYQITPGSPLHRVLGAGDAPAWGRLLAAYLDAWFAHRHSYAAQHAMLTTAVGMGIDFVYDFPETVKIDTAGELRVDPSGNEMMVAERVNEAPIGFLDWLEREFRDACASTGPRTQRDGLS